MNPEVLHYEDGYVYIAIPTSEIRNKTQLGSIVYTIIQFGRLIDLHYEKEDVLDVDRFTFGVKLNRKTDLAKLLNTLKFM